MQSAVRFPYSPATLWTSNIAFWLCRSRQQQRMVMRAQNWYHDELLRLEAGEIDGIRGYPFDGRRHALRLQVAVGLIHLVAVSPLSVLGGVVSLFLLPMMVLVLSVWRLAIRFL
jgi:hypothetical protein